MKLFRYAAATLAIAASGAGAQRLRIIDMHLHARHARYARDNPPPMCTPFAIMPRSEPPGRAEAGLTFNRTPASCG
jgi:hypothetical protein